MNPGRERRLAEAQSLQREGRPAEALPLYRELVLDDPLDASATHYLGMAEYQSGERNEGLKRIARSIVLAPLEAAFYANRGSIALQADDFEAARVNASRATVLQADLIEPKTILGWALLRQGDHAAAAATFVSLLTLNPANPGLWLGFARARLEARSESTAAPALRRACQSEPLNPEPLFLLASITSNLGDKVLAVALFQRLLSLEPGSGEAYFRMGAVWRTAFGSHQAMRWLERAQVLGGESAKLFYEMGTTCDSQGDWRSALAFLFRSRALDPSYADCDIYLSVIFLRTGQYFDGWHYYRARWRSENLARKRVLTPDIGSSKRDFVGVARGQRLLVWAEQGVGDEVMFGGLLAELRGLCGEMLLQVDRRLMGLFGRAYPGVQVFERGVAVPEDLYDEQIPMGSLGSWLRPTRESFIGKGARYLQAQAGLGAKLRGDLGVDRDQTLIGLSWRSESPVGGALRSLSLGPLVAALSGSAVRFVNLQYGDVRQELTEVQREFGVQVLSHPEVDNRENLEGLAGLIEGCDLVVSVGNATAHLSGALGQTAWVLLPHVARWPWLHEGSGCPWYQSVTLFRQREENRWESVLESIGCKLSGPNP